MEKIFCDECVFGLTVNFLKVKGLDTVRAQDLGLRGASDDVIYSKAQELKRILITNDQGFGDIRRYPPSQHFGIIVLKMGPHPQSVNEIHSVLQILFDKETQIGGCLFIVDEKKYRKRRSP